ncbi:MAG TPA: hypothetical protein VN950_25375 [Terriglobales bacterium]|nr:hypothetical protein [Terriglobales bacterium]
MATATPQKLPPIPDLLPEAVQWKLFRAQEHLIELAAEVRKFYQKDPAKVVRNHDAPPDEFIGEIVGSISIPGRVPCLIGDFLTNLRSSFDYLVWELVLTAKNTPTKDNMFPICTTPEAFNQQLARHRLDGLPPDAVAEIDALQPYHDEQNPKGNVLAMIDDFCNINKHRRVLTTIITGGEAPDDFIIQEIDGQLYGSLSFDSVHKKGIKIGPFPMVDGPHGRGPKVNVPPKLIAFVAFNEGTAQRVEIGNTLSIFIGYAIQKLARFEKFFV